MFGVLQTPVKKFKSPKFKFYYDLDLTYPPKACVLKALSSAVVLLGIGPTFGRWGLVGGSRSFGM
jgi:hypothetical protein